MSLHPFLLCYHNGTIGHGLPADLDEAMSEAEDRCEEVQQPAIIIQRSNLAQLAVVESTPTGFKARKKE